MTTFGPKEMVNAARRRTQNVGWFDSGGFGIPNPRVAFRSIAPGARAVLVNGEEGFDEDLFEAMAREINAESIGCCGPSFGFGAPEGRLTCFDLTGDSVIDSGGGLAVTNVGFARAIRDKVAPMSEAVSADGLEQLSELAERMNDRGRQIADYRKDLKGTPGVEFFPVNFARMTIKTVKQATLIRRLSEAGYSAKVNHQCLHVDIIGRGFFPFAEIESTWLVSLPVGQDVSGEEVEQVCRIVREVHS